MSTMLYSAELEEVESGTPQVPTTDTGHLREGQSTKLGSKSLKFGTLVGGGDTPKGKILGAPVPFWGSYEWSEFQLSHPFPKIGLSDSPEIWCGGFTHSPHKRQHCRH